MLGGGGRDASSSHVQVADLDTQGASIQHSLLLDACRWYLATPAQVGGRNATSRERANGGRTHIAAHGQHGRRPPAPWSINTRRVLRPCRRGTAIRSIGCSWLRSRTYPFSPYKDSSPNPGWRWDIRWCIPDSERQCAARCRRRDNLRSWLRNVHGSYCSHKLTKELARAWRRS